MPRGNHLKIRTLLAGILLGLCVLSGTPGWAGDTGEAGHRALPPANSDWPAPDAAVIRAIEAYYAALTSGDVAAIETFVLPDERFVMLEGRHANFGWADYRDDHLASELDDLSQVRFRLSFYRVQIDGALAYAAFAYEVLPKEGPEMDFGSGFATAVLELSDDGWKLRHLQT